MKNFIYKILKSTPAKILYWSIGIFILSVFLLDDVIMPWYVNSVPTLSVPNLVGMKKEDAQKLLDSLKFETKEVDTQFSQNYPAGYILVQNPLPNQIVKQGRRMYLTISGGEQTVAVPQLRGQSVREVKFTLERFGLKSGITTYAISSEFPEETIISQNIAAGTQVKRGTFIGYTISVGGSLDSIVVPNLIGKTFNEAKKLLTDKRLSLGKVTYQINQDLLPNTVVDQFPREGEIATIQKSVDVFVVQAPIKK